MSEYKGLGPFAKQFGLESEWKCWEENTGFSNSMAFIEVCKRIEALENKKENNEQSN